MDAHPLDAFDEDNLARLVRRFYGRVREDPRLGPIFERAIGADDADWEPHLQTLTAFWHTVMLHKVAYKGDPVARHRAVEGIAPEHFERWLQLFEATAREVYDDVPATYLLGRARRMGRHLVRNLFDDRGEVAAPPS